MKIKNTKVTAVALAAILTVSALMGCAAKNDKGTETSEKNQTQEDTGDKFRPSELGTFPQEKYEYPYLGLNAVLTKTLLEKMESRDVMMITDEDCSDDGRLRYAAMYWYSLTEEQKNEEVEDFDPYAWIEKLAGIGVLGVYSTEAVGELDELTGCTEHKELGKSEDGEYTYYLSYADTADENLKKELEKTEVTLIPMQKLEVAQELRHFPTAVRILRRQDLSKQRM